MSKKEIIILVVLGCLAAWGTYKLGRSLEGEDESLPMSASKNASGLVSMRLAH